MTFKDRLLKLIVKLETENLKENDKALERIIIIFKSMKSFQELKKKIGLINRIAVDSVKNVETIEEILTFTNNYTK